MYAERFFKSCCCICAILGPCDIRNHGIEVTIPVKNDIDFDCIID